MTRKSAIYFRIFAVTAVLVLPLLLNACNNADNPIKATGDLNDDQFQAAQDELNDIAMEFAALDWIAPLWDSIPGWSGSSVISGNDHGHNFRGAAVDDTVLTFSIVMDDVSKWVTIQASVTDGQDTATLIDSIRFFGPGGPGFPAELGDSIISMNIRVHANISANDSTDFVGIAASHVSMTAQVLGFGDQQSGDTILINAIGADSLIGTGFSENGYCDLAIVSSKVATNLVEVDDDAHECPIDGSIHAQATLDLACYSQQDSLEVNSFWTVDINFNSDQTADVSYENPTTRWTAEIECSQTPSGSPVASISFPRSDN